MFKPYLKREQTDRQTDISTYRKHMPRGPMLWKYKKAYNLFSPQFSLPDSFCPTICLVIVISELFFLLKLLFDPLTLLNNYFFWSTGFFLNFFFCKKTKLLQNIGSLNKNLPKRISLIFFARKYLEFFFFCKKKWLAKINLLAKFFLAKKKGILPNLLGTFFSFLRWKKLILEKNIVFQTISIFGKKKSYWLKKKSFKKMASQQTKIHKIAIFRLNQPWARFS